MWWLLWKQKRKSTLKQKKQPYNTRYSVCGEQILLWNNNIMVLTLTINLRQQQTNHHHVYKPFMLQN